MNPFGHVSAWFAAVDATQAEEPAAQSPEVVVLQTLAAAAGVEPMVATPRMSPEVYRQPDGTHFEMSLDAEWRRREDARLERLARLTRKHGPRQAALRMFARPADEPARGHAGPPRLLPPHPPERTHPNL